jgi:hypothetical protein
MSDESNNTPASPLDESTESQIERMLVASGAARGELPAQPRISAHPSMSVKLVPGQEPELSFHSADDIKLYEALNAQPEGDIPDDGRDLEASLRQMKEEGWRYIAEAEAHGFDPITGEKVYKLGEAERVQKLEAAAAMLETIKYQMAIYKKIQAQRDRKAAEKEAAAQAEVQREQYLNEQAIRRADEMEIEKLATAIYRKRHAG